MKGTDKTILVSLLAAGLLAAFYFMVLSPKRQEAKKVSDQVSSLESQITAQEDSAAYADQARKEFPKYYGRMVVLGKAVPEAADSASLLVQLNQIAENTHTSFQGLRLGAGGDAATASAPTTPAPTTPPTDGSAPPADGTTPPPTDSGGTTPTESTPTGATPSVTGVAAPATETSAASVPIGSFVGPAGLPTLPYDLDFTGDYFQVADYIGGLDDLISINEGDEQVSVNGRLMTVDGFAIKGAAPSLDVTFAVTSYTTPSSQGLTLGATPEGPATSPTQPELTPASSVTP